MTHSLSSLPTETKVECFCYLSIEDLGNLGRVCRELNQDVAIDSVWESLYPATFARARDSIPQDLQNLVDRPYRRNSVGWSVSVLQDGSGDWLTGTVLDYRNDKFLVRYDLDEREVWERETMTGGAWFVAGKLRVKFHCAATAEAKSGSRARVPSLTDDQLLVDQNSVPLGQSLDEESLKFRRKRLRSSPCMCGKKGSSQHSWRCEAFRDRTMAPTRLISELKVHSDEVLCVAFSHTSNRLASCSRDGTTRIHDVELPCTSASNCTTAEIFSIRSSLVIKHSSGDVPCRVSWSPDDSLLLVSTEAKNGNIFDYDAHVACYDAKSGKRLFKKPNIPFDVCAAWIPGTRIFIHGESLCVSPRGTYHQILSLFDCEKRRAVGRFHFRFVKEAFIHLIQVSPDGNFLAVTCGLGDALSDTVRVVRIPALDTTAAGNLFEIRVPRAKFSAEKLIENSFLRNTRNFSNTNSVPLGQLAGIAGPCSDDDCAVPSFYCGGAVLGLTWASDSRRFFTNTRIYLLAPSDVIELGRIRDTIPSSLLSDRPDLDNTLEIQEWTLDFHDSTSHRGITEMEEEEKNLKEKKKNYYPPSLLSRMKGAHGFTTKDCPFYLFIAESPCGEYLASGSEDCGVYIYHVRHKRLLRVLWQGHEDVVSIVSWNPTAWKGSSCLLASASDDKRICFWTTSACNVQNNKRHRKNSPPIETRSG